MTKPIFWAHKILHEDTLILPEAMLADTQSRLRGSFQPPFADQCKHRH